MEKSLRQRSPDRDGLKGGPYPGLRTYWDFKVSSKTESGEGGKKNRRENHAKEEFHYQEELRRIESPILDTMGNFPLMGRGIGGVLSPYFC